jgi:3-hydroxybutyryl-CoA dehydrogenase
LEIKKVTVIGAGAMGSGIAYLCAWKGYEVAVREVDEELLKKGLVRIREDIVAGVSKGKMSPKDAETIMNRVKDSTDLTEASKNADIVIEAVFEDINIKKDVFKQL